MPQLALICVLLVPVLVLTRRPVDEAGAARSYAVTVPAALLIVTFGVVNARLVYILDKNTVLIAVITFSGVLILMALLSAGGLVTQRVSGENCVRGLRNQLTDPRLRYWIPAFLVTYPVIHGTLLDQQVVVFGPAYGGLPATATLLAFNVGYLAFIWVLVGFGVDQITVWSTTEFWRRTTCTLRLIAGSAPLLLVGVAFFALTAETWQIASTLSRTDFLRICGVQLALAVLLSVVWSWPRVFRQERFESWEDVAAAITLPRRRFDQRRQDDRSTVVNELRRAIRRRTSAPPVAMPLGVRARINALLVVLAYQFFVFAVIIAVLFVMFLWLAWIAVPPRVAAEWIFGDGQGYRAGELAAPPSFDSPWLRVPLLLTMFSNLYFATHSLASKHSRLEYFRVMDTAITTRYAIRLGYLFARWEENGRAAEPVGEPGVIDSWRSAWTWPIRGWSWIAGLVTPGLLRVRRSDRQPI